MSVEVDKRAILFELCLLWSPRSMSGSSGIEASACRTSECVCRWPVVDEGGFDAHTDAIQAAYGRKLVSLSSDGM